MTVAGNAIKSPPDVYLRKRALPWLLLLTVVLTPVASAETYRIGGQATYSDNTPVMLRDVFVECPRGEVDCYQYRGTSAITDANGQYMIALEVEEEDDTEDTVEEIPEE